MIGKMILPWFGGAASVWTVCLLFFQVSLLGGYAYAHLISSRLNGRTQAAIHVSLVAVSLAVLPIIPNPVWKPADSAHPSTRILLVLAVTVGLPYFVLSSTSPLLQAWWSRRRSPSSPGSQPSPSPYRFYALSNVGSMLALLSYPILVEPQTRTRTQALAWSAAYVVAGALCSWIAIASSRSEKAPPRTPESGAAPVGWKVRLMWITLAAIGSSLLLAITSHITQDIAAVPFLWVPPLALYLLSFILCFDNPRWYYRKVFVYLMWLALGWLAWAMSGRLPSLPISVSVTMLCGSLFACCMFCHGELARMKPDPAHLTVFYLMVSLGGAIGAVFVAMVAPRVFLDATELPISIGLCAIMAVVVVARDSEGVFRPGTWRIQPVVLAMCVIAVTVMVSLTLSSGRYRRYSRFRARNFYGILRVVDKVPVRDPVNDLAQLFDVEDRSYRQLVHGTVNHGVQFLAPALRRSPASYYSPVSGLGILLTEKGKSGPLRVGVIGLGAGAVTAYARAGDSYRLYEINPTVINIAQREFTFLKDSPATMEIVEGDGRLSLERETGNNFDVLVMDAFSGDSVPVHLISKEAFELYFRQLKADGVLAVNVTNAHLDLAPVVCAAADALGKTSLIVTNEDDIEKIYFSATWAIVSSGELPYRREFQNLAKIQRTSSRRVLWTDDYSGMWRVLKHASNP